MYLNCFSYLKCPIVPDGLPMLFQAASLIWSALLEVNLECVTLKTESPTVKILTGPVVVQY